MQTYTPIQNYADFVRALTAAGFSMGGGNAEGIYAVIPWGWNQSAPYETSVQWHTGNADTDPWEWRIRVLDEREDIAYAKLFFRKSGFITKEWYPYFWAARRGALSFEDAYAAGTVSQYGKRIYELVAAHGPLPLHGIKQLGGFAKEDKVKFDRALEDLQMKMYLTMCGRQQKLSQKGEEYGWSSTVFCTAESFFAPDVFAKAAKLTKDEAIEKITGQILQLNPAAPPKKIQKFILG